MQGTGSERRDVFCERCNYRIYDAAVWDDLVISSRGILEVLRAMNIVINLSDDEHRDNVSDDENFNELVSVIKRVFENMMDKTSIPVNNSEKNNGNNKEVLTMQEKIHMAEESYSKFEKPKDMKMYSVYLD